MGHLTQDDGPARTFSRFAEAPKAVRCFAMEAASHIHIKGAREHNLKNLELRLPRGRLVVITGPSGSGKSSLAFDTLYAEGYRKYMESLSTEARQILGQLRRPDVDFIHGLSPVLAIQHPTRRRPPPAPHRRHRHRNRRLCAPALGRARRANLSKGRWAHRAPLARRLRRARAA